MPLPAVIARMVAQGAAKQAAKKSAKEAGQEGLESGAKKTSNDEAWLEALAGRPAPAGANPLSSIEAKEVDLLRRAMMRRQASERKIEPQKPNESSWMSERTMRSASQDKPTGGEFRKGGKVKGYASGGKVRGGGCERQGKTRGKFV